MQKSTSAVPATQGGRIRWVRERLYPLVGWRIAISRDLRIGRSTLYRYLTRKRPAPGIDDALMPLLARKRISAHRRGREIAAVERIIIPGDGPRPRSNLTRQGLCVMNFMPPSSSFAPATESYDVDSCDQPDRNGEGWTEEQIILLVRVERLSNAAAAVRMGRTESSAATAVSRYGARDPRPKLRPCLGDVCNGRKMFFSLLKGNRICTRRQRKNSYLECA